jgi:hypothetical protein
MLATTHQQQIRAEADRAWELCLRSRPNPRARWYVLKESPRHQSRESSNGRGSTRFPPRIRTEGGNDDLQLLFDGY